MAENESDFITSLLSILRSLPLWILLGLAGAGYAALFAPSFGDVDLFRFRRDWGNWFWLCAVVFTVLSAARIVDELVRAQQAKAKRRLQYKKQKYYKVYALLYQELADLAITTSSNWLTRSVRLANTRRALAHGSISSVWKALRKKESDETGTIDQGGRFPFTKLRDIVNQNLLYSDQTLINLVGEVVRARMEDGAAPDELTAEDMRLFNHIFKQRNRLKKYITGEE